MGPIWAVIIAGAVLMVLVQFLPDKENAQKLAHFSSPSRLSWRC